MVRTVHSPAHTLVEKAADALVATYLPSRNAF
jgi:hypothetical protein